MTEQPFIVWQAEFITGIAELDNHHQIMVSIINRRHRLRRDPTTEEDINDLLQETIDYSTVHFRAEETYMHQNRYPYLQSHYLNHQGYKDKLTDLIKGHVRNGAQLSTGLLQFLKEWWLDHILTSDMHFAEFLMSRKSCAVSGE